jgi:hypothetical protein
LKKLLYNRLALSSLLASAAVVALVAYVTVFAAPPPSTIQACYNDTNGNLRLVSSPSDCRNRENPVSWNVAGAPGPAGPPYLVEARWRKGQPTEADLAALKTKVDKKITSTRGLFVSILGFRQEVVLEFTRGVTSNIVLMDGMDLLLILAMKGESL